MLADLLYVVRPRSAVAGQWPGPATAATFHRELQIPTGRKRICMKFCKDPRDDGCGTFLQFQGNLRFCTSHCCKLKQMDPVGLPPGRGPMPIVDDEMRKVPGPAVDPLPHVDIKHGKRLWKHPKNGLDTDGEEKKQDCKM